MDNNANKILAGVAALLTVVLLALVISSGNSGGGGGGGAPAAPTQPAETEATPEQPTETETGQQQPTETAPAPTTTVDYDPTAEKQMTIDELEEQLSQSTYPVGDNPRDAATSQAVPTVATVAQQKTDRGFGDLDLIVDFDINGTYTDPHVVDASSADKYPAYKMLYTSSSGVIWAIYVNDGHYQAIPVGSQDQQLTKEIIVCESDAVVQYDGMTNQYSDFPLTSLTDEVGVRVTRVDAATLDSYTIQTLAAM